MGVDVIDTDSRHPGRQAARALQVARDRQEDARRAPVATEDCHGGVPMKSGDLRPRCGSEGPAVEYALPDRLREFGQRLR